MAILIGLIFIALGISLAVGQWDSFLLVLRSVVALGLLFWGIISVLVGYSELKARREYSEAVAQDDASPQKTEVRDASSIGHNGTRLASEDSAGPHKSATSVTHDTPPVSPAP